MNKTCQSCSIPLTDANRGTEENDNSSEKFCKLCYANGVFMNPDMTISQMQATVIEALKQKHWPSFLSHMAAKRIPKLERWNT